MTRIPTSRFIEKRKGRSGNSRVRCEGCGKIKRVLHQALIKGKILCSTCRARKKEQKKGDDKEK